MANVTNSGTIEANLTLGLTLTAASGTVTNSGTLESASAGGLTITSAVVNTGSIVATKGTLTVDGAVSGAGAVLIEGGTTDLAERLHRGRHLQQRRWDADAGPTRSPTRSP